MTWWQHFEMSAYIVAYEVGVDGYTGRYGYCNDMWSAPQYIYNTNGERRTP
jgi:hypothetical protein